jgi:hypothetical protein
LRRRRLHPLVDVWEFDVWDLLAIGLLFFLIVVHVSCASVPLGQPFHFPATPYHRP